MRVFQFLLGGRRWALYLPFLLAYFVARDDRSAMDISMFVGTSCFFGFPYWLAYWLSDAFRDVEVRPFNSW